METLLQTQRKWTDQDQDALDALTAEVRRRNALSLEDDPDLFDRIDRVRRQGAKGWSPLPKELRTRLV